MKKHLAIAPALAAVLTLSLSACSSSNADTSVTDGTADTTSTPSAGAAPDGSGRRGGGFPGASGEVAAVQGDVLQVQSAAQGQVAVTLTGRTTVTAQVPSSLEEVTVGSCVVVVGAGTDDGDAGTSTATSVRVTPPADGECGTGAGIDGGGGRGTGGGRPSGAPTDRPGDGPGDRPSDAPGARGTIVAGKVAGLDDSGFTVDDTVVAVDDTTTFTATEDGSADDITVGSCVSAQGEADETGAITASSVSVSDKVDGECVVGLGGGFGGPGRRGSDDATDQDTA